MDLYQAIQTRHTVRDLLDTPIPLDTLKKILSAGLQAPSNDHMRCWEFILVQDPARRCDLIQKIRAPHTASGATTIIDEWGLTDPVQRAMYIDGIPKQQAMLVNTGCLIIPCYYQQDPILHPKTLSSLNPFASIWCCIENILLAAAAEGIFGVTRIPFEDERRFLKEALKLPDGYEVPCYLSLGYPRPNIPMIEQITVVDEPKIHYDAW